MQMNRYWIARVLIAAVAGAALMMGLAQGASQKDTRLRLEPSLTDLTDCGIGSGAGQACLEKKQRWILVDARIPQERSAIWFLEEIFFR